MSLLCIGHRGACGHAPENTLASFAKAIEFGCPWVELDVYTVEGELVVIHDRTLERTTNGQGEVMDARLDYLRSLDAGEGERIPLLSEVIELVDHRAGINVELKGPGTAEPVNRLLAGYCARGWRDEEFLISSFDHGELARSNPRFRRGALFDRRGDYFATAQRLKAYSLNVSLKLIDQALVDDAHRHGLKIFVYTVNSPAEIARMRSLGVDGIFTNYPDRV